MSTPANQPSGLPLAIVADSAPLRTVKSLYPEQFSLLMEGRSKQPLGTLFGLNQFGVNLTRLAPGAISALRHAHSLQDEFIYIISGHPSLKTDEGLTQLAPGMCAGFQAGSGNAHQLINLSEQDVVYLEVGDRSAGDQVSYPDDDLQASMIDGQWRFSHKDGSPY
ncbi:cupin domain-containing protein [Undibacterium crateris]|uniref:cupin domain-containing protein n=1 Tax=Undibacterium crateris TaxID=2528175 RepID=UPI001389A8F1|nr:cupin domain-containing protein [Undibacterium crateris]NDI87275.1 cupin domain-containing protein [Undibacterium crateris]